MDNIILQVDKVLPSNGAFDIKNNLKEYFDSLGSRVLAEHEKLNYQVEAQVTKATDIIIDPNITASTKTQTTLDENLLNKTLLTFSRLTSA